MFRWVPLIGRLYSDVEETPKEAVVTTTNAAVDAALSQPVAASSLAADTSSAASFAFQSGSTSNLAGASLVDPLPEPENPLSPFYARLTAANQELDALVQQLIAHEKNYMRGEKPHPDTDHAINCRVEEQSEKVKSNAALIFDQIKAIFQSARDDLQDIINEAVDMHLNPLRKHIADLLAQGNDKTKSESERRDIAIHAIRVNIALVIELRALLGNIKHDLEQRVWREGKLESTAGVLINLAIYVVGTLVGLPLPSLNFDCTERFAHKVDNEIKQQEIEALLAVAEVEGLSDQTVEAFKDLEAVPSGTGMFTPRRVQNDGQAPDAEEARSELRKSFGQ